MVKPGVTAGAMILATVGCTSAMFLVVMTMKSKDRSPLLATLGIELHTAFCQYYIDQLNLI